MPGSLVSTALQFTLKYINKSNSQMAYQVYVSELCLSLFSLEKAQNRGGMQQLQRDCDLVMYDEIYFTDDGPGSSLWGLKINPQWQW